MIVGNLFINFFILLFSLIFLINIKKNKILLNDSIFYILLFFFTSLLINIFFSSDPLNSLPRVLKIIFVILFLFEIKRLFNNNNYKNLEIVFKMWSIIFLIVLFDIIFEITFGQNILGFVSDMPGRIASFFNKELVVGAYLHGFVLFFLGYIISKKYNSNLVAFTIIGIIIITFLVGERSNFIKSLISISIFSLIVFNISYKRKILFFLIVVTSILTIINFNNNYKLRYYSQIKTLFTNDGFSNYMKQSQYGAHQDVAIKIFKEYPYFGIGIKNFRNESVKNKYENQKFSLTNSRHATHPHQVHHEFLSETGIVGYLSFLFFVTSSLFLAIKNYLRERNIYQLASIIFICSSLLPYIPSGSFLSTFSSGFFWINYAIMIGLNKKSKF